jgi:LysM repeat protein
VARTVPRGCIALIGSVGLGLLLTACFGGDDAAEGPTSDTGGASSNTVVTLAPPPPPVTQTTIVVQQPPEPPPTPPEPPPTPPTQPDRGPGDVLIYPIEQGDTLFSIARKFGVSVDALIELNNIANPDVIRAGDELFIPPPE